MIGELSPEPSMYRRDQVQILGGKSELSSVGKIRIVYLYLRRTCRKLPHARHIGTVKGSGIGKVSRAEPHCFVLKMLADESDLLRIV